MGELERCERETAEAGHLARRLGDRHTLALIQGLEARLAHHARQTGEADRLFEDAVRALSDIGAVYDLGRCYYEWGVRTLEKARAAARLGTAARLFERIGALRRAGEDAGRPRADRDEGRGRGGRAPSRSASASSASTRSRASSTPPATSRPSSRTSSTSR